MSVIKRIKDIFKLGKTTDRKDLYRIVIKPYLIDSFSNVSNEDLDVFEKRNNLLLPKAYREFLLETNGGKFSGEYNQFGSPEPKKGYFSIDLIYGLNALFEYADLQSNLTIFLLETSTTRSFLPVANDSFGNWYCISCSEKIRNANSPVFCLEHELNDPPYEIAKDFNSFIDKVYTSTGSDPETDAFLRAIEIGDLDQIQKLFETHNYDADKKGRWGDSALTCAARHAQPRACKLLLDLGFDVNERNASGETALHMSSSVDVIKILLDYGADIEARDQKGETPFLFQLRRCFDRNAYELLCRGAKLDVVDYEGNDYQRYLVDYKEVTRLIAEFKKTNRS